MWHNLKGSSTPQLFLCSCIFKLLFTIQTLCLNMSLFINTACNTICFYEWTEYFIKFRKLKKLEKLGCSENFQKCCFCSTALCSKEWKVVDSASLPSCLFVNFAVNLWELSELNLMEMLYYSIGSFMIDFEKRCAILSDTFGYRVCIIKWKWYYSAT